MESTAMALAKAKLSENLNSEDEDPASFMSSQSWVMMNMKTQKMMFAKHENEKRQVASLIKIMTLQVIIDFMGANGLDSHNIKVNILSCCVTSRLPFDGGTSAELLEDD